MYYNSNFGGSHNQQVTSTLSLENYKFTSPGAGQGQFVADNAASAVNHTAYEVDVFTGEDYSGSGEIFAPGAARNLTTCYNNIDSVFIWN